MKLPFLERRSPLGISYALLILIVFFFLLPSAFQSARLSLKKKENDIKDWLPADFRETAELEWFGKYFAGDSFVLATWPGCHSGDQRLELLERKLRHESAGYDASGDFPPAVAKAYARAQKVGLELQLLRAGDSHDGWGGRKEKWLSTPQGQWYYITPDGRLYRWNGAMNGPAAVMRGLQRTFGSFELDGQLVTAFGVPSDDERTNPFYNDPSLLCAPLFQNVQTGDSIARELAREGGPLWPVDLTDPSERPLVAKRRAMKRLTGTLFAPAVPEGFRWTPEAFREVVPAPRRDELPADFDAVVAQTVARIVEERYGGELQDLLQATTEAQADSWYEVFDTVGVEPPPRLTCVLVSLTDLAKKNLAFALGRGLLGGPRGRLLELAEQSGVQPAPSPSLAPPPFDRPEEDVGMQPPLHMGGPPVDNIAIDEQGTITLVRLVGYSILVGVTLSYLCFASVKITIMVFIVGGSAAVLSMAVVGWTGGRVDAILMSMPSLVYVLGLSGAIHVINYYRDEIRARGEPGAPGRAVRHALVPCTLAATTTAIGLISLFTSNLAPISNFGFYSAVAVVATLAILFSYLPAALQVFAPGLRRAAPPAAEASQQDPAQQSTAQPRPEGKLSEAWASVGRWITGHHRLVAGVCGIVLVTTALGLYKIQTSVQLLKLFDSESRIIRDYAWLEANFGKLVPMELVLRVPPEVQAERAAAQAGGRGERQGGAGDAGEASPGSSLRLLERVEAVARIRTVVHQSLGEPGLNVVGQAMGADTFLPPLPEPQRGYSPVRSRYNEELLASIDELRASDYLRIEETGPYAGSELWRISLRVGALSDVDYGRFISTLKVAVEPVLRAYDTRDELIRQLTAGGAGQLAGKDRVLLLGSERPPELNEIGLMPGPDGEPQINTRATYLATLDDLLRGERIQSPYWLEPTPERLASEQWERMISQFDAVIWVGGEGVTPDHLASAQRVIDGRKILAKAVEPRLIEARVPDVAGSGPLQVIYTGAVPVVYKAQRTLLTSLTESIGLAFVLIAVVMVVLLNPGSFPLRWLRPAHLGNGLAAGAVSMIPNAFPVLLVFGAMGHAGILVDIGTMMTASVAMGVAVDDTIHFLSWYRSFLDEGKERVEAVIETYRRVGPAMTQTTIVGGLGLFVFALSTFTPTQRFGTLMLILLMTALVGDLIFLPALLAGPLGRVFKPREAFAAGAAGGTEPTPPPHAAAGSGGEAGDAEDESAPVEKESLPQLRVHMPQHRTDRSHPTHRR